MYDVTCVISGRRYSWVSNGYYSYKSGEWVMPLYGMPPVNSEETTVIAYKKYSEPYMLKKEKKK